MVVNSDILLRGTAWHEAVNKLSNIFKRRTNYSIFIMSVSIGIMYDKQIDTLIEDGEESLYVPRTVLNQYIEDLDFLFQTAILTTNIVDVDEEKRLELAFGDENKKEFDRVKFLIKFANFGIVKIIDEIGYDELDTMENIKNFLTATMEGTNFEIYSIDDELEIDIDDISKIN